MRRELQRINASPDLGALCVRYDRYRSAASQPGLAAASTVVSDHDVSRNYKLLASRSIILDSRKAGYLP